MYSRNYFDSTEELQPGPLRGEPSGEVRCPVKGAIAKMRCWEFQKTLGCGFKCPLAVKADEIHELRLAMKQTAEPGLYGSNVDPERCANCGRVKSEATTALCAACARGDRAPRVKRRSVVYYSHCQACGRQKSANTSPRCARCGQLSNHGARR